MSKDNSDKNVKDNDGTDQNINTTGSLARIAEHRCLAALSAYATKTKSIEITRPSLTNCPDSGHDLGITGSTEEVKEIVSILTGSSTEDLSFLDKSAKSGKLKVRVDVKNVKTISGDNIDKHAADSSRSPDCQVNLLMLTNPDVIVTPVAQNKLKKQKDLFRENGTLVDITSFSGLQKIEKHNVSITSNDNNEE